MADTNTRIDDGFSTKISFSLNTGIKLWEVEMQLPGMSMGGAIDTNHMRRVAIVGQSPKKLIKYTDSSFPCMYAESTYNAMKAMMGKNQLITITMPFGGTVATWGWIDEFMPDPAKIGDTNRAMVKIIWSCENDSNAEVAPLYTAA